MQMSVDGKIEGPEGYADWVDAWSDHYDITERVDACLLGRGCIQVTRLIGEVWETAVSEGMAVVDINVRRGAIGTVYRQNCGNVRGLDDASRLYGISAKQLFNDEPGCPSLFIVMHTRDFGQSARLTGFPAIGAA